MSFFQRRSIRMKEEIGKEIREFNAATLKLDAAICDVRKLDAEASKEDVAACKEDKLSRVFNVVACEIECHGIGLVTQKKIKSLILYKLLM